MGETNGPTKVFLITIDTEIDRAADWRISDNESFKSVLEGIPQKLTPLFEKYGVKPTYLLSSEVIENQSCSTLLSRLTDVELGTHLHGDLVEPERKYFQLGGTFNHAMQCSYAPELERAKLGTITKLFENTFGYAPSSFRAGRFGAGMNTISSLIELGYRVDSSVTPGIEWNYPEGRADYREAPLQPYFPGAEDFLKEGALDLLEVPVSIVEAPRERQSRVPGKAWLAGVLKGEVTSPVWLRPSFSTAKEMVNVLKILEQRSENRKPIVANMMFHSMEVVPGASPYTSTEEECQVLVAKMEKVLQYCVDNDFRFVTLSELYPLFQNNLNG